MLAFLVGVSVGVLIGRRAATPSRPKPIAPLAPESPVITKRGRKAGLSEEAFVPSDDILEKLRLAAEGELDPAELAADDPPPRRIPPTVAELAEEPEEPAPRPPVDPRLAEAEQRILDRLRRQQQGE